MPGNFNNDDSNNVDVVISGLSGRFPMSDSIEEFAKQLFDNIDLVTEDDRRWPAGYHGLPKRFGKLNDLSCFDAMFFGVHGKQANTMDPQQRSLLEVTFEAIVDAAINPAELRSSRTGVFVGVSNVESEAKWLSNTETIDGYVLPGCSRSLFANRISYSFDFKGPSLTIDTACSSSLTALVTAVDAIRSGKCDAAVVAGSNLCLNPCTSMGFQQLSMLSPVGRCATFDADAQGFVRAEAVVVLFLQRREQARRVYATVRGGRVSNDGHKIDGITFPNGKIQKQLAEETFKEAKLNPLDVAYFEAHGTGTKIGDQEEVNAIAQLFCKDRETPLLIGSVKSNMGHSEPASGLCAITKILIAMEKGMIPANLHYNTPNPDIPALVDGRLHVVDRNTPWEGGLVAVNSFGFGGANAHVILESERGPVWEGVGSVGAVPRLVVASGRTEVGVRRMLALAAAHPARPELHALLDAVHAQNVVGHAHRGYALLHRELDAPQHHVVELESGPPRPVWFVFSGMGSQWAGMARALLQLPVFAASVRRAAAVLRPHHIDLLHVLTDAPEAAFNNIINSFVVITAVQIALVDVLRTVGITPDGMIGHSLGELGCAYADDALTAEQVMLSSYWRGRSVVDAKLAPGAMAAVGLSWKQCETKCPAGVFPACHNCDDNTTVAGPVDKIEAFVKRLREDGLFAKRVKVGGAFHSQYVNDVAPLLSQKMKKIIPKPKRRSFRWISTSLLNDCMDSKQGKLCDAEYMVHNLVSPVRFAEALQFVPARALVVELAPHALLQAVLKRALPGAAHVPLLRCDQPDQAAHLFAALGKIYCAGAQPQVARLYPAVQFPVPRGTPGLASAVEWDHTTEWNIANYGSPPRSGEILIVYDLSRANDAFIAGHHIDGRILFPASGYLFLVWKTVALLNMRHIEDTPVVLEHVEFKRATIMSYENPVRFLITVTPNGEFEINEAGSTVASGNVRLAGDPAAECLVLPASCTTPTNADLLELDSDDIYKELRLRGYNYAGIFRGILTSDALGTEGTLSWAKNWVPFLDTMLQFTLIGKDARHLTVPKRLLRVYIDPEKQRKVGIVAGEMGIPVRIYDNVVVAGGVELRELVTTVMIKRNNKQTPKIEKCVFLPYDNDNLYSKRDAVTVSMQLVVENMTCHCIKVTEYTSEQLSDPLLTPLVLQALETELHVRVVTSLVLTRTEAINNGAARQNSVEVLLDINNDCNVILGIGVITRRDVDVLAAMMRMMGLQGAMLMEEPCGAWDDFVSRAILQDTGLKLISRQVSVCSEYLLFRRATSLPPSAVVLEITDDDSYAWLEPLRAALQRAETEPLRVYAVARSPTSGLLGLGTCLRAEPGGHALRIYFLPGERNKFTPDAPTFAAQVRKDLTVNVLRGGGWGTYRHLLLKDTLQMQLSVKDAYVSMLRYGDLSSLRWFQSELQYAGEVPPPPDTELCHVYYAALNYKDILLATRRLSMDYIPESINKNCLLGLEFSGRTSSRARVMGMVAARGLATTVQADKGFLWEVPAAWSLEEAATVPVVYATAYYALVVRGRMTRGESVLVHAGSGGVGQAAIAIALHAGCTVYTTVGTADKRAFLQERFPSLPPENVGSSRDASFEQLVRRRTDGRGVDLVLNSLAGDMLLASVRCLAVGGRFLEIGKGDVAYNLTLAHSVLLGNRTIHGVTLDQLLVSPETPTFISQRKALNHCIKEGIANGVVRPLTTVVFCDQQLEEAFRFMATGKHIGKVLVRVREEEALSAAPVTKLVSAIPRTYMHPGKSYVLVGGLGGFGLELGWWLVYRGARHLVVVGRGGVRSGYQAWCVRRWRARGVAVCVLATDAAAAGGARAILAAANQLAPIGGVFNLAVVIRDAFLENQTPEHFRAVAAPKIRCTETLDAATRELAPKLDYFVVFSSMACGRGSLGQSNYGFANSAMERIIERRRAEGLPGLAIQWGAVGDVGWVTKMKSGKQVVAGTLLQSISSCMKTLEMLLTLPHELTASMVPDEKRDVKNISQKGIVSDIAEILGIQNVFKSIPKDVSFLEYGMDSLMSTEIKETLQRGYNLILTVSEIRALTFRKLQDLYENTSKCETNKKNVTKSPKTPIEQQINGETFHGKMLQSTSRFSELVPKQVVVALQSAAAGGGAVFMVHPIEGVVGMLQRLAAGVRGRVFGLQCTREAPLDDMSALARFYVQHVRAKQPRPPYTLLGYSFGAAVAFEMALQLQKANCKARLVLVDGSPAYSKAYINVGIRTKSSHSTAMDEAKVLGYFTQAFMGMDTLKIIKSLEALPDWEARLSRVIALIGNSGYEYNEDEILTAANSFYHKLVVADSYRPAAKLHAPVHLFTARDNFVSLGEDYGLREVCSGALSTAQLPADHQSIVTGDCVAVISQCINNLLRDQQT